MLRMATAHSATRRSLASGVEAKWKLVSLARSTAPGLVFKGGVKEPRSGSTLSLRPETSASSVESLRPRASRSL